MNTNNIVAGDNEDTFCDNVAIDEANKAKSDNHRSPDDVTKKTNQI